MKKISAALLIVLLAGCSSMGMHSNSSGGMGMHSSGEMNSSEPLTNQPVINPETGGLTLYHGG